jgi:hypothetical protein
MTTRMPQLFIAWFLNFIIIFFTISFICQCYRWLWFRRTSSPGMQQFDTNSYQQPLYLVPSNRQVYEVRECSPKEHAVSASAVSTRPITLSDTNATPATAVASKPVTLSDTNNYL